MLNVYSKRFISLTTLMLLTSFAISGCATKRYGRLTSLTAIEKSAYDCTQIEIEIAKCDRFISDVEEGAEVDAASVFGFLGDWGIGNKMEKDKAMKSARSRLEELNALKYEKKCP
ncbi:hypothetical protein CR161_11105 [Prosthecochloris sp. ZM]|uniref:hypothetical protein n=1 Tax=Prosthecochloris sp. ZM TaxID=2283143 RepID=UPI000DF7ED8A|nr:hypothetical protein [Prosthecochloris sp. ZM]RDD31198.1 hypothetical protein CR161_11105 [Prosthecochloris sp. ZM]